MLVVMGNTPQQTLWTVDQAAQYWGVSTSRARGILSARHILRISGYPVDDIKAVTLRQGARTDLQQATPAPAAATAMALGDAAGYTCDLAREAMVERINEVRREVLSDRATLQAAIAAQLATGHSRSWVGLSDRVRADYLADADALIEQGMTSYWEDHDPGEYPSAVVEAEAFEFDRAMTWFMEFLDARHPGWRETNVYPSEQTAEPMPGAQSPLPPVPSSAPNIAGTVTRDRFAAAVGAVLANRHSRRWMYLPSDVKRAYLADAYSLMDAQLTYVS
jgi:hypothetical protein